MKPRTRSTAAGDDPPWRARELAEARSFVEFALERCRDFHRRGENARPGSALEGLWTPSGNYAESLAAARDFIDEGELASALHTVAWLLSNLAAMMDLTAAGMAARSGGEAGRKYARRQPGPGKRPRGRPAKVADEELDAVAEKKLRRLRTK